MKLEYVGSGVYRGTDQETGFSVSAKKGSVVEVSEKKGKQLVADFPKDWKKADDKALVSDPVPQKMPPPFGEPRGKGPAFGHTAKVAEPQAPPKAPAGAPPAGGPPPAK